MSSKDINKFCNLQPEGLSLHKTTMEKLNLSAQTFDRFKKSCNDYADLDYLDTIKLNI